MTPAGPPQPHCPPPPPSPVDLPSSRPDGKPSALARPTAPSSARPKRGVRALLALLVVAFYALHQDVWNWREARPFVFGFIPVGLAYHAAYSAAAALLMALLVRCAWPAHLESAAATPHPTSSPESTSRRAPGATSRPAPGPGATPEAAPKISPAAADTEAPR